MFNRSFGLCRQGGRELFDPWPRSLVRSEKCGIFYHVTGIGQSFQRANLPGIVAEEPLQLRLFSLSDEPGENWLLPNQIM